MPKNIVIFFLSPFRDNAPQARYTDVTGRFSAVCTQTNETALKYIEWQLAQKGEGIDAVYCLASRRVGRTGFRKFKELFADKYYYRDIYSVDFDEDKKLAGSFYGMNIIFQILADHKADDTVVHLDLTGGFRHTSMLMMAMLQLLKYEGMPTGYITYVNYNRFADENLIENVNVLAEMYNMIGGTAEFSNSGSIMQLKEYFAKQACSAYLQNLLAQMEIFSERIKICSQESLWQQTVNDLNEAIQSYKEHLPAIADEQEKLFSRMLPAIERDYAEILQCNGSCEAVLAIIGWCIRKGLLQQAATMATELLPVYFTESGMVKIEAAEVTEACKSGGKLWSNWQVHLFKNYQPSASTLSAVDDVFNYKRFRWFVDDQAMTIKKLQDKFAKASNDTINKFFDQALAFEEQAFVNGADLYIKYKGLPADSLVKAIIAAGVSPNVSIEQYLNTRYLTTRGDIDKVILGCLRLAPKERVTELFAIDVAAEPVTARLKGRGKIIANMCSQGLLSTPLKLEALAEIVNKYVTIVDKRNAISHASGNNADNGADLTLSQLITDELQLIKSCMAQ